jgi:hypothetical protein
VSSNSLSSDRAGRDTIQTHQINRYFFTQSMFSREGSHKSQWILAELLASTTSVSDLLQFGQEMWWSLIRAGTE